MKKFFNKLEAKLDSSSQSSQQQPQRPGGAAQHGSGSYTSSGPQYSQPSQQSYNSGNQYQQPQQGFQQPSGPPPNAPGVYSQPPGPPPQASQQGPASTARPGVEDPFAALRRYDTVFVVDDSESMEMFWDETREAVVGVVEKSAPYDEDGIDIYFFNSQTVVEGLRSATDVRNIFRRVEPRRSTPTARALKRVVEPYLVKLEAAHAAKQNGQGTGPPVKPLNVVVLTDGAPDRNESPEGVIVDAGKRLDAMRSPLFQLGFSFIQIGADEEAQDALNYLDDHLKTEYNIRDMVDTTLSPPNGQVSADYLLKALLGGVNRKLDKQN